MNRIFQLWHSGSSLFSLTAQETKEGLFGASCPPTTLLQAKLPFIWLSPWLVSLPWSLPCPLALGWEVQEARLGLGANGWHPGVEFEWRVSPAIAFVPQPSPVPPWDLVWHLFKVKQRANGQTWQPTELQRCQEHNGRNKQDHGGEDEGCTSCTCLPAEEIRWWLV